MTVIRKAVITDIPAITGIYNEAVLTTTATFDNQPRTAEEQLDWFNSHDHRHPVMAAEYKGKVIAWASLSEWSTRCAYADTAELSVYVKAEFRNKGVGKILMASVLDAGRECGLHTILSRIVEGNGASIHLHEVYGFQSVGTMHEVGFKFEQLLDVRIMQLIYGQVSEK